MENNKIDKKSLFLHQKNKGKIATCSLVGKLNYKNFASVYTPGVAIVSKKIKENKNRIYDYTIKSRLVGVVSDGTAVLGLGNVGPEAALPVIEGKALLIREIADIDAVPLVINAKKKNEIVEFITNVSPTFGAIIMEDIAAPDCFFILKKLQNIGIPVFHDDQIGAAIAVYAALINASRVVKKKISDLKVVVCGVGAAGTATIQMLLGVNMNYEKINRSKGQHNVKEVIAVDKNGIICRKNKNLREDHKIISEYTNNANITGSLSIALKGADVLIGLSVGDIINEEMVKKMNKKPIVFSLANPVPEISRLKAEKAGAFVYASGRSDDFNQINNALVFPGLVNGLLESRAKKFEEGIKYDVAEAISSMVKNPRRNKIIPKVLNKNIVSKIKKVVVNWYV